MAQQELVKLFDSVKIRVVWDDEQEKYFFSIVDVVGVLTESVDGRKYWNKLKQRLREEGNESVTNCHQLKLPAADGKKYLTDVADTEQLLRIIQSIPSKKAEPFKQWLASVGAEVARNARADIEHRLGHSVISKDKAIDHITPKDELPFTKNDD